MTKTRSQTGELGVKKEEQEDRKPTLHLNDVTRTTRNIIAKRKSSKNRNRTLLAQQVKVEEDTDIKSVLQSTPELPKGRYVVSQEQINQLIDAIVNDKMSIRNAARKVKMCSPTAHDYYNLYKNDPNHNIPISRSRLPYTQDQKDKFIGYVVNDKMTIKAASEKAKMNVKSAKNYYHKYFDKQNPDVATPSHITFSKRYTQEQTKELISYITNDKMSIQAASIKANIGPSSAGKYYRQYLKDHNMELPAPRNCNQYPQDKIRELIGYIVEDKMTIRAASKKANMSYSPGKRYYHNYFNDQNPDIAPPSHITIFKSYTQEQIKQVISYIVDDKMSINAASIKANMKIHTARNYYRRYLKDNNMEFPVSKHSKRYTKDEINKVVGYIVDDKMSITAASKKANMPRGTALRYYRKYSKDHNLDARIPSSFTQDKKNELIRYIVEDKMSLNAASRKVNISYSACWKYYHKYLNDPKLDLTTPNDATKYRINKAVGYIVDDKMSIAAASKTANMNKKKTGSK